MCGISGEKSLLLYSSLQRWFSDWMGKECARLAQWGMGVLHWSAAALTAFSLLSFGVSMYWSGQTIELQQHTSTVKGESVFLLSITYQRAAGYRHTGAFAH
jgi:hypothetical protein